MSVIINNTTWTLPPNNLVSTAENFGVDIFFFDHDLNAIVIKNEIGLSHLIDGHRYSLKRVRSPHEPLSSTLSNAKKVPGEAVVAAPSVSARNGPRVPPSEPTNKSNIQPIAALASPRSGSMNPPPPRTLATSSSSSSSSSSVVKAGGGAPLPLLPDSVPPATGQPLQATRGTKRRRQHSHDAEDFHDENTKNEGGKLISRAIQDDAKPLNESAKESTESPSRDLTETSASPRKKKVTGYFAFKNEFAAQNPEMPRKKMVKQARTKFLSLPPETQLKYRQRQLEERRVKVQDPKVGESRDTMQVHGSPVAVAAKEAAAEKDQTILGALRGSPIAEVGASASSSSSTSSAAPPSVAEPTSIAGLGFQLYFDKCFLEHQDKMLSEEISELAEKQWIGLSESWRQYYDSMARRRVDELSAASSSSSYPGTKTLVLSPSFLKYAPVERRQTNAIAAVAKMAEAADTLPLDQDEVQQWGFLMEGAQSVVRQDDEGGDEHPTPRNEADPKEADRGAEDFGEEEGRDNDKDALADDNQNSSVLPQRSKPYGDTTITPDEITPAAPLDEAASETFSTADDASLDAGKDSNVREKKPLPPGFQMFLRRLEATKGPFFNSKHQLARTALQQWEGLSPEHRKQFSQLERQEQEIESIHPNTYVAAKEEAGQEEEGREEASKIDVDEIESVNIFAEQKRTPVITTSTGTVGHRSSKRSAGDTHDDLNQSVSAPLRIQRDGLFA